ncbi:hypothetical protein J6590_021080 [Homalodisca vitripennis]|nr:hypothetical protein J6590_021080 [Homalodisca vitripennis]
MDATQENLLTSSDYEHIIDDLGYVQHQSGRYNQASTLQSLLHDPLPTLKTEALASSVGPSAVSLVMVETDGPKALCHFQSSTDPAIDPTNFYLGHYQKPACHTFC